MLVHFVNSNPGRDIVKLNSDDVWADEIPEVGPYRIALRLPRQPKAIAWEPGHRKLPFIFKNGTLSMDIPRFRIHGCLGIEA